jgi:hypothetical protein
MAPLVLCSLAFAKILELMKVFIQNFPTSVDWNVQWTWEALFLWKIESSWLEK